MKIELIKLKFNDTCAYKHKPFQYCCDEIQNDKAIVFTGEDLVHSDDCWDDERYIPQFCTSYTETFSSWVTNGSRQTISQLNSVLTVAKRLRFLL